MMSEAPEAVCMGGTVRVSSGLRIANLGRIRSKSSAERFRPFSSLVTTEARENSLPVPAKVEITPRGRIAWGTALPQ